MRSRTGSRSVRASSGIAVGEQLHRALEIGEEHGDLLALAFEGALRGEDLLGEVLGGVGLGRARECLDVSRRSTGGRTPGRISRLDELTPAVRTGTCQRSGALLAERGAEGGSRAGTGDTASWSPLRPSQDWPRAFAYRESEYPRQASVPFSRTSAAQGPEPQPRRASKHPVGGRCRLTGMSANFGCRLLGAVH